MIIIAEICSLKFQDPFLQFFLFVANPWKFLRLYVISPFKHKVHNWRTHVVLYVINLSHRLDVLIALEFGCFHGDYKYHYCFGTVYQSHLVWSSRINLRYLSWILLIILFDVLKQNIHVKGQKLNCDFIMELKIKSFLENTKVIK